MSMNAVSKMDDKKIYEKAVKLGIEMQIPSNTHFLQTSVCLSVLSIVNTAYTVAELCRLDVINCD